MTDPGFPEFQRVWCRKLFDRICAMHLSEPFQKPVISDGNHNPGYHDVVKNPMDLGTIREKLINRQYNTAQEWADDVRLVWYNALSYNYKNSSTFLMAQQLSDYFEKKWKRFPRSFEEQWMMRLERVEAKVNSLIESAPSMKPPAIFPVDEKSAS